MKNMQVHLILPPKKRGIHLITSNIEQMLNKMEAPSTGLLNLFLQHTSAALTINENADPLVRADMEQWLDRIAPENESYYQHIYEGADDLPAHLKSSMVGISLTIPISKGSLGLGTWQGIYLLEFRNHASARHILLTLLS